MRILWTILTLAVLSLGQTAEAQNPYAPALTVNESVITRYDIDQRSALLEALGATGDVRADANEQLIDDRLKLQAAEDLEIDLPEGAIEAGIAEFAAARDLTLDQVLGILASRGVDRQTMDDFVEAGIVWREVVVRRFRDRAQPSDADLDLTLDLEASTPREILELGEIALPFEERGEAETLQFAERLARDLRQGASFTSAVRTYSRSGSAAQGGNLAPIPATELPPAIRSQVLLLTPGQVTDPIPIAGGVAILRLNAIRQEPAGTGPAGAEGENPRDALRQRLFSQRITSFGDSYLQELRGDALIVER